ncbi:MAG: hypothetical protein Q9198_001538, partial [Flavoplaca austrocitrina]
QAIEQQLDKLDKIDDRVHASDARATQPGEAMGVVHYRHPLLGEIEGELSEYNSMVLRIYSFAQTDKAKLRQRYTSVGQFLKQGPGIHKDRSMTEEITWLKYELAVKQLLNERGSAFLNKPLDRQWLEEGPGEPSTSRSLWSTIKTEFQNGQDLLLGFAIGRIMQFCWHILFWAGHITAALGFGLVASMPESEKSSIAKL